MRDRQRRLEVQASLVQGSAEDRAAAADHANGPDVVDRRDPARRDDRAAPERDQAPAEREVRAVEEPVAVDGGHLERLDADVGQSFDRDRGVDGRRARGPAVADGVAITHVDRDGDARRAVGADQATGERRVPEGRGPDDDPGGSSLQGRGDGALVAEPTGHLDPGQLPYGLDDRRDHLTVCRHAGPRAIEVDHVDPSRSSQREPDGDLDRIGVVRRLPVEVTLAQSNDATAPKVDRRQDLERACSRHGSMIA